MNDTGIGIMAVLAALAIGYAMSWGMGGHELYHRNRRGKRIARRLGVRWDGEQVPGLKDDKDLPPGMKRYWTFTELSEGLTIYVEIDSTEHQVSARFKQKFSELREYRARHENPV